jgi:sugar/nucleoside kinase (ribokinase family)
VEEIRVGVIADVCKDKITFPDGEIKWGFGGNVFVLAGFAMARVRPLILLSGSRSGLTSYLDYRPDGTRVEKMKGEAAKFSWDFASGVVHNDFSMLDAIYINFISGEEIDLFALRQLREKFDGLIALDIHQLFYKRNSLGLRCRDYSKDWREWLKYVDYVQFNQSEAEIFNSETPTEDAIKVGADFAVNTNGPCATVYSWREGDEIRTAKRTPVEIELEDTTGCGDVFGAVALSRLIVTQSIHDAVLAGQIAAAANGLINNDRASIGA